MDDIEVFRGNHTNMNWQEVCDDQHLQDLPYKVELNRFGQVVMSPASNEHGYFQTEIAGELRNMKSSGRVITECSVETSEGTKVADVSWGSAEFIDSHGMATPFPQAPEICVEIVSPSNTKEELELKSGLYFEAGAKEVWFCSSLGTIEFRKGLQTIESSELFPEFPQRVG